MEFLLPKFTEVVSTPAPMQFIQEISFDKNTSFILANITAAVAESLCVNNKVTFLWYAYHYRYTCCDAHVEKSSNYHATVNVEQAYCDGIHLFKT